MGAASLPHLDRSRLESRWLSSSRKRLSSSQAASSRSSRSTASTRMRALSCLFAASSPATSALSSRRAAFFLLETRFMRPASSLSAVFTLEELKPTTPPNIAATGRRERTARQSSGGFGAHVCTRAWPFDLAFLFVRGPRSRSQRRRGKHPSVARGRRRRCCAALVSLQDARAREREHGTRLQAAVAIHRPAERRPSALLPHTRAPSPPAPGARPQAAASAPPAMAACSARCARAESHPRRD